MPWTAPRTWVVGELVTAAFMNTHVRDNLLYLQTYTQDDVTGARAIDGTIYQNTKDHLLYVSVNVDIQIDENGGGDIVGQGQVQFDCEGATPPTIRIGELELQVDFNPGAFIGTDNIDHRLAFFFVVVPTFYYRATSAIAGTGAIVLLDWIEWSPA